jgi:hypothetical protein
MHVNRTLSWPQWLCGLRHELFSPAETLGSCFRIPLEAFMSVCVYSVFMLSCMYGSGLAVCWTPVQGVVPTVYTITKLKKRPGPRALEPLMNEWIALWIMSYWASGVLSSYFHSQFSIPYHFSCLSYFFSHIQRRNSVHWYLPLLIPSKFI